MNKSLVYFLIYIVPFVTYLGTVCPNLYVADSGEIPTSSFLLSIPHPTGYPLYNIVGHFFTRFIPLGNVAYRLNVSSAIFHALSGILLLILLEYFLGKSIPIVFSVLVLVFSKVYWSQSVVSEVYALNTFLILLLFNLYTRFRKSRKINRVFAAGFIAGIMFAHHWVGTLLIPVLIYDWWHRRKKMLFDPMCWIPFVMFTIVGMSINLYLPARAVSQPPFNWGNPSKLGLFINHVTGRQFKSLMFHTRWDTFVASFEQFKRIILNQFPLPVTMLCLAGLLIMVKEKRRERCIFILIILLNVFISINYRIPDIAVYYIPTFICMAAGFAVFFMFIQNVFEKKLVLSALTCSKLINFIVMLLVIATFISNYYYNNRRNHYYAYDYGKDVLAIPEQGINLHTVAWSSPFIIIYMQMIEHYRPDITLYNPLLKPFMHEEDYLKELRSNPTPLYYTVPPGNFSVATFPEPIGILYRDKKNPNPGIDPEHIWKTYSMRDLENPAVYKDFWTRAIITQRYFLKAEFLLAKGNLDEGEQELNKCKIVAFDNAIIYNNLGNLYYKRKLFKQALDAYKKGIKIDPFFQALKLNIAMVYCNLNKFISAEKNVREYIVNKPKDFLGYRILGEIFLKKGQFKQARYYLETALERKPTDYITLSLLASALETQNDYQTARNKLQQAIKLNPLNPKLYNDMGVILVRLEMFKEAISCYNKALKLNPEFAPVHNNLGNALRSIGKFEESKKHLEKSLQLDPNQPATYNNLAKTLIALDDPEKAMETLETCITKFPSSTLTLNNLGLLYLNQGDVETARKCWLQSLEIKPSQEKIRQFLNSMHGR